MVGTRVTTNIEQQIKRLAEKMGTTPSRIIGNAIAAYLGDTPSPSLADRVAELERTVSALAGATQPAAPTSKTEVLTEQELCDRFNLPHNWRDSIHGWDAETWLSRKTGAMSLGFGRYKVTIAP